MNPVELLDLIEAWLVANYPAFEHHAIKCAERGDDAEADLYLQHYQTLRDRLSDGGVWRSRV